MIAIEHDNPGVSTYMHEIGHTIGLGDFDSGKNVNHGWNCPEGYESCMNYDYDIYDYNDGTKNSYFNDWGSLDFYDFRP